MLARTGPMRQALSRQAIAVFSVLSRTIVSKRYLVVEVRQIRRTKSLKHGSRIVIDLSVPVLPLNRACFLSQIGPMLSVALQLGADRVRWAGVLGRSRGVFD